MSMRHRDQVLALLQKQIGNPVEVKEIRDTAEAVVRKWVNPRNSGAEEANGLIYGLVQSGKTGVLTVTGAIGADEGYKTIIILTSDNNNLYDQTLVRVREAFPGIHILEKDDFKDASAFIQRVKDGTCAIVTTKNASRLKLLVENFKAGNFKGVSCLIIDDEADQASLNTKEGSADGSRSAINNRIATLRDYFVRNTYLQVTATPQALFLQTPGHDFRPQFTVLSRPGADYVGGEDFFGDGSNLVREYPIEDVAELSPGAQPEPSLNIPKSLVDALDIFMVAATFKRMKDADQNCAFLCHVSTRTSDHKHIVDLLWNYKTTFADGINFKSPQLVKRLRAAYEDLAKTHSGLKAQDFNDLLEAIAFFSPGINVKLVNKETDEDVAVVSPFNLFVGGTKLGRGVTIKNLLVSYYGRHPKKPQADTVLQHARMYGYRRKDIGLLRLFLPEELHTVFKAINKMEIGLRDLIERRPTERFRGIFLENGLSPTRKNVLSPGSLGVYSGGSNYNPAQILRDESTHNNTHQIDAMLAAIPNKGISEFSIADIRKLLSMTMPDDSKSQRIWDSDAIAESVVQFSKLYGHKTGTVYVDRNRDLKGDRRETQGVLDSGEYKLAPTDKLALYMLRTKPSGGRLATWWPQIRFPDGGYAFAFSI